MARYQKSRTEVISFLENAKTVIVKGDHVQLNSRPWKGKVNKTLAYMARTGITKKDIENVICELQLAHYSYTADDQNDYFKNEQVWIFGITKDLIDEDVDLYIKLKIRSVGGDMLLIMSFHPQETDSDDKKLKFPYA